MDLMEEIENQKDWSWCVSDGDIDYDVEIDPIKRLATVFDRGWYNYTDEDPNLRLLNMILHPRLICEFGASTELIELVRASNDYFAFTKDMVEETWDKRISDIVVAELRKKGIT